VPVAEMFGSLVVICCEVDQVDGSTSFEIATDSCESCDWIALRSFWRAVSSVVCWMIACCGSCAIDISCWMICASFRPDARPLTWKVEVPPELPNVVFRSCEVDDPEGETELIGQPSVGRSCDTAHDARVAVEEVQERAVRELAARRPGMVQHHPQGARSRALERDGHVLAAELGHHPGGAVERVEHLWRRRGGDLGNALRNRWK
jgi:hypothetical protein